MSRTGEYYLGDRAAPATYPIAPGFTEPTTSAEAASVIAPLASIIRDKALLAIAGAGSHGMTSDEAAIAINEPWPNVRPRISELKALKLIRKSNQPRRPNKNGRSQTVWEAI